MEKGGCRDRFYTFGQLIISIDVIIIVAKTNAVDKGVKEKMSTWLR